MPIGSQSTLIDAESGIHIRSQSCFCDYFISMTN